MSVYQTGYFSIYVLHFRTSNAEVVNFSQIVQVFDSLFSQKRDYLNDKKKTALLCFFLIWWKVLFFKLKF